MYFNNTENSVSDANAYTQFVYSGLIYLSNRLDDDVCLIPLRMVPQLLHEIFPYTVVTITITIAVSRIHRKSSRSESK